MVGTAVLVFCLLSLSAVTKGDEGDGNHTLQAVDAYNVTEMITPVTKMADANAVDAYKVIELIRPVMEMAYANGHAIRALKEQLGLTEKNPDNKNPDSVAQKLNAYEKDFARLRAKELVTSAFAATLATWGLHGSLVFSKVLMNVGDGGKDEQGGYSGYDGKTGVYTAPYTGIYNFQLVLAVVCDDCHLVVDMMKNDDVLGRLTVMKQEQSSISPTTKLMRGDKVAIFPAWSYPKDRGNLQLAKKNLCLFSGFLLHATNDDECGPFL